MTNAAHHWNPADYARHSRGQEQWARELFSLLRLRADESLLDVGCGDGRLTAELAQMVPRGRVVGVDSSREMIVHASEHFPPAQFPNLKFQHANVISMSFHHEFDVVYSNAVLHWVRDQKKAVAAIAKALKPGGRCVLQMGGKGNGAGVISVFEHCLKEQFGIESQDRLNIPYVFSAPQEFRQWLEEAGLVPGSVELIEKDMIHANRSAFTGWLRTAWLPYAETAEPEQRDQFLETVTTRYIREHPLDKEGQVHVGMVRLQVLARKE